MNWMRVLCQRMADSIAWLRLRILSYRRCQWSGCWKSGRYWLYLVDPESGEIHDGELTFCRDHAFAEAIRWSEASGGLTIHVMKDSIECYSYRSLKTRRSHE